MLLRIGAKRQGEPDERTTENVCGVAPTEMLERLRGRAL
jgi:hypothetical protein